MTTMNKTLLLSICALASLTVSAQGLNLDSYAGAQMATEDLNGTARYVGMGGAMDALGADLSTMGSNPAGIGLYRKNQIGLSFGLNVQEGGKNFHDGSKTNASFDQVGVVFAARVGPTSYFNFGFNFHKSRNFDFVLSAADQAINGSSLQRQTYVKMLRGDLDKQNPSDPKSQLLHPFRETQVDQMSYRIIDRYDSKGKYIESISPRGIDYTFDRAHTGYIGEYDFNLSGNINNRVYLGLTVGIHDVHYNAYSEYFEHLNSPTMPSLTSVLMSDDHRITGQGYDVKAGIIVRPFEASPFRFGVSVSTPTWYKLSTSNTARIGNVEQIGYDADFRFYTPWKFGASLGHVIDNMVAVGLSYEYADYGSCDMRAINDYGYDWDGYYHESSASDREMERLTQNTLRGVSTLKVGAEVKADEHMSFRVGYNYVSPMYKEDGVRDQSLNSPGTYMASTTDYTNWKATNRLTAGVGFTLDKWRIDVAYQYQMRKGDFYPFMHRDPQNANEPFSAKYYSEYGLLEVLKNECSAVSVKDNRHQLMCSVTYSF